MATELLVHKKSGFIASLVSPFLEFRITGLDISDLSIKYFAFDHVMARTIGIRAYGEIECPPGIIASGEIKDEEKLIALLKEWYAKEKKKIKSPFVVFSLPEEKSFIRLVQIPRIKHEDIANAIRWEIENQIPLPLEEVIYDYEVISPLSDGQDHLDVIITAFPRNLLMAYVHVLKEAGLEPYAIELEPQSIVRACVASLLDPEAKILVDVGRTRTSIVIFAGGIILYTSTIDSGGLAYEEHIAKALTLSSAQAKQIKVDVGLDPAYQNGEVFQALTPIVATIGDELIRAISYYQTHATHVHGATQDIARVLMSGGDANLRGLDTYLASLLRIPAERIDPFSAIRDKLAYTIPPLTKRESLAFSASIGLALRAIYQESL